MTYSFRPVANGSLVYPVAISFLGLARSQRRGEAQVRSVQQKRTPLRQPGLRASPRFGGSGTRGQLEPHHALRKASERATRTGTRTASTRGTVLALHLACAKA
jgi:hypothetical protein